MTAACDPAPLGAPAIALRVGALALLLGLITTTEGFVYLRGAGRVDVGLVRAILLYLPYWLFWAAMSPAVVAAVRGLPLAGRAWPRHVLAHIAVAAALMLVHSAALYASQRAFGLTDLTIPIPLGAVAIARWRLAPNLLAYGAIAGLVVALDAARAAREREREASRLAGQLATARLDALRRQLDPHFLFNALNTVSMLVRQGRGEQAVEMVAGLGTLLRRTLDAGHAAEVPLAEELGLLRSYLDMERARFGDRLRVTIDAPEDTLRAHVPSLVLQPLVENALRHGIARRAESGALRVAARRVHDARGDRLLLEVEDDGAGLPHDDEPPGAGVGIANTVERLERLYGDRCDFSLRNGAAGGAIATVAIPFRASGPR